MSEPLSLDTLLSEFEKSSTVWVLRDAKSGQYVTIPHPKYPGRLIMHLFMSRDDAANVLDMIIKTGNTKIASAPIVPVQVNLHEAMASIAAHSKPTFADGFVVHPPNEVFGLWWSQQADADDDA